MQIRKSRWLTGSVVAFAAAFVVIAYAQGGGPKASPAAKVSQTIGSGTEITVSYHRPGVKGREIWGDLVPNDEVWRAGANSTTTFSFSKDVRIEGESLAAGTYGFYIIPKEDDNWVVIFNKVSDTWGSGDYDEDQNALRLEVEAEDAPHQERLVYGFDDMEPDSGPTSTAGFMHWEKKKVSFAIGAVE